MSQFMGSVMCQIVEIALICFKNRDCSRINGSVLNITKEVARA